MIVKERDCVETRAANVKRKSADPMKALSANLKRQREGKKLKCISPKETDDTSENAQIRSLNIQPRYINTLESSNRASDVRIHLFTRRFPKRKIPQQQKQLASREKKTKNSRVRANGKEKKRATRDILSSTRARVLCSAPTREPETKMSSSRDRDERNVPWPFFVLYI
jgi:hypothetical protein